MIAGDLQLLSGNNKRNQGMKKYGFLCVFFVFISVDNLRTARGAEMDRVIAVLVAIKNRQDSYNPVDVRYKVKRTYTKYRFAASQRIHPEDKRLFSPLRDVTTVLRGEYSVKGDRLFFAVETPGISAEGKLLESSHTVSAYDGTLFKQKGRDGKLVVMSRKKPIIQDPLSTYNGEQTMIGLLSDLKGGVKPDALTVTENPGRVPGAALSFRIAFGKGEQESILDVWVSSEAKEYGVLRFERRLGGKLFHEYSNCEYKQVDGIWFPFKAMYRNYYHNKNIHQIASEERLEVERISCRADEIPDSKFIIPVTNETELIDRDRNDLRIVGPDKVDKHILEAVADVERERTGGGWYPWLYELASALLLLGAAYLGIRIFLARRRGKSGAARAK